MSDTTAERWLTVEQAAGYLGVSEPTVFRWMRDGKLSHFKLGKATRFTRESLDACTRKVTGRDEGELRAGRCAVCGHSYLAAGEVRSTGKLYFQPEKSRFWVLSDSMVRVSARACPVCGHIQMFADTEKLARLLKREELEASRRAGEPTAPPQRTQRDAEGNKDSNDGRNRG